MISNIYRLTAPGFFLLLGIMLGYIAGRIEAAMRSHHHKQRSNRGRKGMVRHDILLG